jgi:hypothetical protein
MKRDCLRVEEAIWEAARNGDGVPIHVRQHLDGCRECARAATEAGRITQLLQDADRVPEAPDCTSGVTALIFNAPKRQVWSYAWVGAAAVILILTVLATLRPGPHTTRPVVAMKQSAPVWVALRPDVKKGTEPSEIKRSLAPCGCLSHGFPRLALRAQGPRLHGSGRVARARIDYRRRIAPERVAVSPQVTSRPAAEPIDPNRPVAVAVVSWGQQTEAESNSYEYAKTDADGRVTTCKVVDTGDVVKISLASTPANSNL